MKRYVIMAAIALLAASCSNESEELETETETLVPVTVQVNDFSVSMEDPNTRATDVASYDGIKALTLAFYDTNGTEVYKTTQQKSDNTTYTTFGQFDCSLPVGSYTMVALARQCGNGDEFTICVPDGDGMAFIISGRIEDNAVTDLYLSSTSMDTPGQYIILKDGDGSSSKTQWSPAPSED